MGCHFLLKDPPDPRIKLLSPVSPAWQADSSPLSHLGSPSLLLQVTCKDFPGGSDGKASVYNAGVGKIPWRRKWQSTPVLLPGKSHEQRSLVGYSPWGRKELDTTERLHFHFHALEKEMATHSSVLAWRIPGTGEPGGLPSMGLHRVGHD